MKTRPSSFSVQGEDRRVSADLHPHAFKGGVARACKHHGHQGGRQGAGFRAGEMFARRQHCALQPGIDAHGAGQHQVDHVGAREAQIKGCCRKAHEQEQLVRKHKTFLLRAKTKEPRASRRWPTTSYGPTAIFSAVDAAKGWAEATYRARAVAECPDSAAACCG